MSLSTKAIFKYWRAVQKSLCLALVKCFIASPVAGEDFYSACAAFLAGKAAILEECSDRGEPWSYYWNGEKVELFAYVRKAEEKTRFAMGCVFQKVNGGHDIVNFFGIYYSPDENILMNITDYKVEAVGNFGVIRLARNGKVETLTPIRSFRTDEDSRREFPDWKPSRWANCAKSKYAESTSTTASPMDINRYVVTYRIENRGSFYSISECWSRLPLPGEDQPAELSCKVFEKNRSLLIPRNNEIIYSSESVFITRDGNMFIDNEKIRNTCGKPLPRNN